MDRAPGSTGGGRPRGVHGGRGGRIADEFADEFAVADHRAGLAALTARPRRAGVAEAAVRDGAAQAAMRDGAAQAAMRAGAAEAAVRDGVGAFAAPAGAPHSGYFMTPAPAARAAEKILDRCCRDGVPNDPRSPITPGGDPREEILAGRANQPSDEHCRLTPAPAQNRKPCRQLAGLPPFHSRPPANLHLGHHNP